MSSLKPSLLSCAIAFCSLPVTADNSYDSFIADAKIDGKVQTVFFNDKDTSDNKSSGAWTGAIWLNAQTGYFADFVSVGGSAYRVVELDMKDENVSSSDLLNADKRGLANWARYGLISNYPRAMMACLLMSKSVVSWSKQVCSPLHASTLCPMPGRGSCCR